MIKVQVVVASTDDITSLVSFPYFHFYRSWDDAVVINLLGRDLRNFIGQF